MKFFQKYRIEVLLLSSFSLLYFFLRIYRIMSLPIFTDEAIYVRWAQIAGQDSAERFISLTDGKQPLFVWLSAAMMRFIHDPLLAGRMVSVGGGFLTVIGLFFLGREVFKNKWVGIVSAFLYLIYPFGLVYDRMALYDCLIGTFAVWALYVEVLLVRRIRSDLGFTLGFVIGAGMLNKTNAFFSMYLMPFTALLFPFKQKLWKKKFFSWALYAFLAIVIANILYSVLRLSPLFYIIAQKNAVFVYPFNEWIHHPFTFFVGNLHGLTNWFVTYMTLPIIALVIASFFVSKRFFYEKVVLLIWFLLPFVGLALFGKVLNPRYILFMTLSLLPLAAITIIWLYGFLKKPIFFFLVVFILLFPSLFSDAKILTDFAHAPIPQSDLGQYITDWPSGVGVSEIVSFLQQQSQHGDISVITEGTFGLMPYSLQIYLIQNPHIVITGIWPIETVIPKELIAQERIHPTYVVFYQPCVNCAVAGDAPTTWPLRLIMRIPRGNGKTSMTLYQVEGK